MVELCGLELTHVNQAQRTAAICGKGGKWRHVFRGPEGAAALAEYLAERPVAEHDRVFCSLAGAQPLGVQ